MKAVFEKRVELCFRFLQKDELSDLLDRIILENKKGKKGLLVLRSVSPFVVRFQSW